ncbi:MAG: ABC transporter permease [Microbacterium sp.]|uniref:ABC transporter permease n=1 Tax=Microbacterium sp. TaxID=51671 RepID=UPI00271DA96E|nr:ABC transporter permease [Microbacterium sp.]MDO8381689.1 ABC transporter permease [Microbacterium sp.]
MNASDLITTAVSQTFRSKVRTTLTILAIFVGAFTLTLTNGLGTGINNYIDDTVSSIGAEDVMTVTKPSSEGLPDPTAPVEYDPNAIAAGGAGIPGATVVAIDADDLDTLEGIDGVLRVEPTISITPDYIQYDGGTQYVTGAGSLIPGQTMQLAAGSEPDDGSDVLELALPEALVEPLGFDDAEAAVGQTVEIGITDAERQQHVIEATVSGVTEPSFSGPTITVAPNQALTDALSAAQNTGVPAADQNLYAQASVWFDPDATTEDIDALKDRLEDAGYSGTTVADQLGTFTAIIDGIVLVLNAFAVIALLAASFGIVNTLYMSVQDRTREIGLMKAMGMGSGRVFTLFSLEAVFIGFLGSAIGAGIAMLVGAGVSSVAGAALPDLPGLTLIAFDPVSIATVILIVMGIAFLAGTLPAARAARADPVDSLRYE